jgi:hypothetical protein
VAFEVDPQRAEVGGEMVGALIRPRDAERGGQPFKVAQFGCAVVAGTEKGEVADLDGRHQRVRRAGVDLVVEPLAQGMLPEARCRIGHRCTTCLAFRRCRSDIVVTPAVTDVAIARVQLI